MMARSSAIRVVALMSFAISAAVFLSALGVTSMAQETENKEVAPESSKEALVLYAEAASFQNSQQFDLAAVEWAKFLKRHADDPRAIEAEYNLAVCELQERKFEQAVKHLANVIENADEDFERLEDAYLNLGWCQYSAALSNKPEYFATASATFAKLLKKYPDGDFRDQALFFGGESLYLQGKFKEAADSYAELVEKHTKSELHSDAMYALGVTLEDMRQFESAGKIYSAFLKTYPDHDLAVEVEMRKAETILQAGDFGTAAEMFAKVAKSDGFRSVDHALYRQAFCVARQAEDLARRAEDDPDWREKQIAGYQAAAEIFGQIATEMKQSPYARDAAIAAGRAYYRAKDFAPATKWFDAIRNSDSPHAPEAAHWLARILLDDNKPKEAREVVAAAFKAAANHPFLVSLKLDDADALYQNKATRKDSVVAYKKIFDEHRDHRLAPKALYNAAYGAMELGDYRESLEFTKQFEALFPDHNLMPEVRKVTAESKLQLGEHEDAAKVYKELADSGDQDGTKFELRRGLSLFLEKNYDQAMPVLEKVYEATGSRDEKAEAAYWLGRCFARQDQHQKAISAYIDSRAANSEWQQSDEVLLNLGRSQRQVGKFNDAIATVTKLISDYPNSDLLDQAYYRLGEFAYAANDYTSAIQNYSKVLADWPTSTLVPFSLYGRGWSYLRDGDTAKGVADFDQLQKDFSSHKLATQTIYARAMAQHQAGDHQAALESVNAYFEHQPSGSAKSDALYLKGLCYAGMQKPIEAIRAFEELLQGDEAYASTDKVLYELAWAHKNAKQESEALSVFARLVADSPSSSLAAEAHYHLGEDHYDDKNFDGAAKEYAAAETAATAEDLKEKAAYKQGWSHYQNEDYEAAVAAFDRQLQVNDQSNLAADAEFMRGECFFKLNKFEDAFAAYQRAKNKPSKNETMRVLTLLHGGQAAAQLKQWKVSNEWIAELQENYPSSAYMPQATYEQGWALRNLGQLGPALEAFSKVTATSRNELGARARFMMGEVYFEQKKYNAAILEFRRVMFGYGAEKAPAGIKRWQAKSAFEAGRCASVLAGQEANPQKRARLVEGAKGFFTYVTTKHPDSTEAPVAREQLRRLQPGGNRVSNRETTSGV